MEPQIPLGKEGNLRGNRVICIAFLIRGCTVAGERYRWREYLLYAGPRIGYLWLMEEDGGWKLVTPIPPGEAQQMGGRVSYRGRIYHHKQSNMAQVEHVVGELYWRVEIGEEVRANDYQGPGGTVSVEVGQTEVTMSFCEPLAWNEIAAAFGLPPGSPIGSFIGSVGGGEGSSETVRKIAFLALAIVILLILSALSECGDGGGGGFLGPSFGGGK